MMQGYILYINIWIYLNMHIYIYFPFSFHFLLFPYFLTVPPFFQLPMFPPVLQVPSVFSILLFFNISHCPETSYHFSSLRPSGWLGSMSVFEQQHTYPSPKPTLTFSLSSVDHYWIRGGVGGGSDTDIDWMIVLKFLHDPFKYWFCFYF